MKGITMNTEICANWNDVLKRCEALREKCDGMNPKSGKQCRFYKTIAQKKIDDRRTRERLKAIGRNLDENMARIRV